MAKNLYTVRKYDGDDCYSYAVFKTADVKGLGFQIFYGEARPLVSGESKMDAYAFRDRKNKEAAEK